MKIVHIIFSFNTGGAETMLIDIANCQSVNNKVSIIIINDSVNDALLSKIKDCVQVIKIGRSEGSRSIFDVVKLNYIIAKFSPDIIHTHQSSIIRMIFYPFAKKFLTVHAMGIPNTYFSKYDNLFAISNAVCRDILKKGTYNVITIPNGIDSGQIVVKHKKGKILKDIIQVGRLDSDIKGQDILINAVSRLSKIYGLDINLTLIGEGPSMEYLRDIVNSEQIEDRVMFLGLRDRDYIYSRLKDYDLYVQPSRFEGFGLTVAEAMAAKIPVLVSDNDGPMEIINNGEYGVCFKVGDIDDCVNKLLYIYNNYSEVCEKIEPAYLIVKKLYDINETANNYIKAYEASRN